MFSSFFFQVSNMFIVSLAIADLIVGLIVMPLNATYIFTIDWLFGLAVCQIWIAIDYLASTASILNLFILSLDRYWSIMSPLKYMRKRTKKRALIMISFVWLLSSLWIIPITGWHAFVHGGVRTVPSDTCDTEYAKNSAFKVVTAFFNFYLPLFLMFFLYIKIFQEIRKRSKFELGQRTCGGMIVMTNQPQHQEQPQQQQQQQQQHTHHHKQNNHHHHNYHGVAGSSKNTVGNSSHQIQLKEARHKSRHSSYIPVPSRTSLVEKSEVLNDASRSGITLRAMTGKTPRDSSAGSPHETLGGAGKDPRNCVVTNQPQQLWRNNVNFKMETATPYERRLQEYVYDENVVDPLTEKVERYYYEEQSTLCCRQAEVISNPAAYRETSFITRPRSGRLKVSTTTPDKSSLPTGSPTPADAAATIAAVVGVGGSAKKIRKSKTPDRTAKIKKRREEPSVKLKCLHHSSASNGSCDSSSEGSSICLSLTRAMSGKSRFPRKSSQGTLAGFASTNGASNQKKASANKLATGDSRPHRQPASSTTLRRDSDLSDDLPKDEKGRRSNFAPANIKGRLKNLKQSASLTREIKAVRQLGVIMGAFTVCFLPYFILFMVVAFCDGCIDPGLITAMTWIGYLNSTLNPVLYPLCNLNFRRKFRKMLGLEAQSKRSRYNPPNTVNNVGVVRYD